VWWKCLRKAAESTFAYEMVCVAEVMMGSLQFCVIKVTCSWDEMHSEDDLLCFRLFEIALQ
jgi:hypothetical protein